jgi:hypothetical protein
MTNDEQVRRTPSRGGPILPAFVDSLPWPRAALLKGWSPGVATRAGMGGVVVGNGGEIGTELQDTFE